ncbi:glycosyltransferase, partial [Flavobacteriaceae bacterium]|nr:glycosyltransferase [Flavobacteriaceae bacterium]
MNDPLSPPLVSVLILAFNHENYIRETLDNVLGQQTSFNYEIVVHDDASTDATPKIIKEYQKKYPHIIKPILQKENQFSIGVKPFSNFVYPFLKSEFVAYCEGDDYWTDCRKLEKQVAIFRRHKGIVICGHNVKIINEAGVKPKNEFYKKPRAFGDFKFAFHDEFENHFVHTATLMIKTSVISQQPITDNWVSGDIQMILFTLSKGMGFYIDQKMSVKRRNL